MSVAVMNWVFQHSSATLGSRLVLLALADYAQDDGSRSYPSVENIAKKARLSERQTQYALRKLEAEGHIEQMGKSQFGTVVYRILMGGADSAPGGAISAGSTTETAPNPSVNPSDTSSSERAGAGVKEEPIGFSEWIGYHCLRSERQVPRLGTSARAELARIFGDLIAEGYELEDFKLASDGVLADAHMVEGGWTKPENVLRKQKFAGRVDDGRRARARRESESERSSKFAAAMGN